VAWSVPFDRRHSDAAAVLGHLRRTDRVPTRNLDATSFQVMRDRRLREALAFDQDFVAAGFLELRP
jgi:predicted nucleic acid-binding protein